MHEHENIHILSLLWDYVHAVMCYYRWFVQAHSLFSTLRIAKKVSDSIFFWGGGGSVLQEVGVYMGFQRVAV